MTVLKPSLTTQPTAMPTRKMIAFAVSSIITAALLQATHDLAAAHAYAAWLATDSAQSALPILAGALAGYLTRDRTN